MDPPTGAISDQRACNCGECGNSSTSDADRSVSGHIGAWRQCRLSAISSLVRAMQPNDRTEVTLPVPEFDGVR